MRDNETSSMMTVVMKKRKTQIVWLWCVMRCVCACVMVIIYRFDFGIENLPWERWIRTFLHTLAPGFSTKCSTSTMFRIWCHNTGHRLFDGPIEIDTNAVTSFPRVFVGQCEHKRCCISNGCPSFPWMDTNATFWLTEVYHVDGHRKICMVAGRISAKQFWYLRSRRREFFMFQIEIHSASKTVSFRYSYCYSEHFEWLCFVKHCIKLGEKMLY